MKTARSSSALRAVAVRCSSWALSAQIDAVAPLRAQAQGGFPLPRHRAWAGLWRCHATEPLQQQPARRALSTRPFRRGFQSRKTDRCLPQRPPGPAMTRGQADSVHGRVRLPRVVALATTLEEAERGAGGERQPAALRATRAGEAPRGAAQRLTTNLPFEDAVLLTSQRAEIPQTREQHNDFRMVDQGHIYLREALDQPQ